MNSGLKTSDFELSQLQVDLINTHFINCAQAIKREKEDGPTSIKVVLEWIPGMGRVITACYDGEVNGAEIT